MNGEAYPQNLGSPNEIGVLELLTTTSETSLIGWARRRRLGEVPGLDPDVPAGDREKSLPVQSSVSSRLRDVRQDETHIHTASATPSSLLNVLRRFNSVCVSDAEMLPRASLLLADRLFTLAFRALICGHDV